jgi:hypothetical protein
MIVRPGLGLPMLSWTRNLALPNKTLVLPDTDKTGVHATISAAAAITKPVLE